MATVTIAITSTTYSKARTASAEAGVDYLNITAQEASSGAKYGLTGNATTISGCTYTRYAVGTKYVYSLCGYPSSGAVGTYSLTMSRITSSGTKSTGGTITLTIGYYYYSVLDYNANTGSGAPERQTVKSEIATSQPSPATHTISNVVPTLNGYAFRGWAVDQYEPGTGTPTYQPGGTVSVRYGLTQDPKVLLYAVWGSCDFVITQDNYTNPVTITKNVGDPLTILGTNYGDTAAGIYYNSENYYDPVVPTGCSYSKIGNFVCYELQGTLTKAGRYIIAMANPSGGGLGATITLIVKPTADITYEITEANFLTDKTINADVGQSIYVYGTTFTTGGSSSVGMHSTGICDSPSTPAPSVDGCSYEVVDGYTRTTYSKNLIGTLTTAGTYELKMADDCGSGIGGTLTIIVGGSGNIHIKANGSWLSGNAYVKANGTWLASDSVWIKTGGVWKKNS